MKKYAFLLLAPLVFAGCGPATNSPETVANFKTFQDASAVEMGRTFVTSYRLTTPPLDHIEGTVSPKWYTLQPKDKRTLVELTGARWRRINSPYDNYKSTVTLVDGATVVGRAHNTPDGGWEIVAY